MVRGGGNTHRWDFKTWLKLRITRIENLSFEHNYQHDDFDPFFFYLYAFLRKRGKRVPLKRYFIMSFNFSQEIFIFCLGSRLSLSLSIFLLVCSFAPPKLLYQLSSNSQGLFPLWSVICLYAKKNSRSNLQFGSCRCSLWLSFSHCTANLVQITINIGKIGTALYTKFTVNKSCEFTVFTVSQNYVGLL